MQLLQHLILNYKPCKNPGNFKYYRPTDRCPYYIIIKTIPTWFIKVSCCLSCSFKSSWVEVTPFVLRLISSRTPRTPFGRGGRRLVVRRGSTGSFSPAKEPRHVCSMEYFCPSCCFGGLRVLSFLENSSSPSAHYSYTHLHSATRWERLTTQAQYIVGRGLELNCKCIGLRRQTLRRHCRLRFYC